jgi:group I intron endonuclease
MSNINENKKYHFIYKTTNLINNKFYIGMHSTANLNDGYLGSGKKLRYSIRKYGKENFSTQVLEFLPDRESLKKREKEIVNERFIQDENCLNLQLGGGGGFINSNHRQKFFEAAKKTQFKTEDAAKGKKIFLERYYSDENFRNTFKSKIKPSNYWPGKKHRPDTIEKMKKSSIGKHDGEKNSQFGTCWITNGFENKKIKKTDEIPLGWILGRVV